MIGERELFVYDCVIMDAETTQPETAEFRCYWSPEKIELSEVAIACAAQEGFPTKQIKQGISAVLRDAEVIELSADTDA
jgi:hypothetical protein